MNDVQILLGLQQHIAPPLKAQTEPAAYNLFTAIIDIIDFMRKLFSPEIDI
ncbi:MAG: hypothetical protein ACLSFI_09345 [Christensenellaceae bacterium]